MTTIQRAAALAVAFTLSGCAGLPLDDGQNNVRQLGAARGVDLPGRDTQPPALPVAIDEAAAVRIALARNPSLQAALARIGFGAADVYEAARIANPVLGVSMLDSDAATGGRLEIYSLAFAFTDLLTLRARGRMARAEFAALQHEVSARVMDAAIAARHAWLDYAAALELAALQAQVAEAGIVSAELAERFRRAGNLTPRELAEQKAATAMLRADAISADARAAAARAALANALGISSGDDWRLDGGLSVPPAGLPELAPLLEAADGMRLDLVAARLRADAQATRAGVENWSRWFAGISVGAEREREPDGTALDGPAVSVPLPVFDTGRGRVARAQADLVRAAAEVRRLELEVDNGLRLAHAQLDAAQRRAFAFRDALLPARRRAVAEASAQYNFMLIGVFELLEVKRQEIEASQGYVASITDYWRARLALERASGRMLPGPDAVPLRLTTDGPSHGAHDHDMPGMAHPAAGQEHDMTHHEHHGHETVKPAPAHEHGRDQ